jgi:hypothetical protein
MSIADGSGFRPHQPGPNEAAIRKAAALNGLPVDKVMEVPVTLTPQ